MLFSLFKQLIKDSVSLPLYYKLLCLRKRLQIGKNYYLLKKNSVFKDKHKGERCFILGNGPSLNNIDLSCLANEITFSVNQLSRREDFYKLNANYHMWSDARFFSIDEDKPEDMELLLTMKKVNCGTNKPIVFYVMSAFGMIKKYKLDEMLNIYYFDEVYLPNINCGIKFPIDSFVPGFSTIVHYAIVFAVYMGFKEIYLLGCDCTGIINTIKSRINDMNDYEYGYNISKNELARMKVSNAKFPIENELRWNANIFDKYKELYSYCINNRTQLYNATSNSLLESIPKINLEDVLRR